MNESDSLPSVSNRVESPGKVSRLRRIALFLIIFPFCAFCMAVTWVTLSWEDDFLLPNHESRYRIVHIFTLSLMQNREEKAKEVVDYSEWERIEKWTASHGPVDCPPPLPADLPYLLLEFSPPLGEDPPVGGESTASITLYVPCPTRISHSVYMLRISDIEMRRSSDGWIIKDWGDISESGP